ncbi:PKD domain-containing protein [Marivirga atlantica]|uniref:PKD domain-containing protein n=1 Tax=Marivirga atlantica TaxID=1548457 RepID=A0A937DJY3_9BACT|nr:PKD domain-containing protein [Marivirga atlantica]MBL0765681.1 PKD domain-containing protein [Marivirga atlantica]
MLISLIGISGKSYAQCGASSGVGGFQTLEEDFCGGEKQVWAGKSYSNVDVPAGTDVYILVDWGYPGATDYYPTVLEFGNYIIDNTPTVLPPAGALFANDRYAYHVYPENLEDCSYDVDVFLVFVDAGEDPATHPSSIICPGTVNSASTIYWEKDNILPGNLAIEEAPIIRICEGETVTINPLYNISLYNCPLTNNTSDRWFQWIYNIDGGNPIPDVVINGPNLGGSQTFNAGGVASNLNFEEVVQIDPGPNLVPGDIDMLPTGTITIDGTNTVAGQYFDIQLNAWNVCNPFDDPDNPSTPNLNSAANADSLPEFTTVRILIIDEPILDPIEILDASSNPKPGNLFCPEEVIRIFNDGTDLGPGPWTINIYDGPTTADPLIVSYPNQNRTLDIENTTGPDAAALNAPGVKTVEVIKVNNSSDITGGCSSSVTAQYEIIGTPAATIGFDDGSFGSPNTADTSYEICAESLPLNLELTDETPGKTVNLTTEWLIEKVSPNSSTIDNIDDGGGGATAFDYPSNPLIISDTGHYRVQLYILDGSTNCTTSDQLDIYVYDTPEALFSATGVCEGEDTDFDPSASNIPTTINGEVIDQWLWDFSYDGVTFNTELTRTNDNSFTRNLGTADDYEVALITRTDKGCYSDTTVTTVSVYANPNADLQALYGQDYETFVEDDPYTGDPICPGTLIKFFNNSDEASNDPSVVDVGYYLEIDSIGTTVTRAIGGSGTFATPDIFYNTTGSNVNYSVQLIATANPTDGNPDNDCVELSAPIVVEVLPGSPSGFTIYEDNTKSNVYEPTSSYCSPHEFTFEINNVTNNLLNPGDSVVWEVFDGATLLGGDTIAYSTGTASDYDFSFLFENDFPSIAPINYTITLQPFSDGFCVNSSSNTVRVLPKPISNFAPTDTVVTCDSVTFYFEAEQAGLLNYFWNATPVDSDAIADTLIAENINGPEYWVSFGRPADTDPPLTINVTLQTENVFGCPSDLSGTFTANIQPEDNFNIDLVYSGTGNCLPNTYTFTNNTIPADIPANTEWELHITNVNLGSTTIINTDTLPASNKDFSAGFVYEFTQAANYEIRLIALLESTCDLASDPPISLTFNNSPQMGFRPVQDEGCSPLELDLIDVSFNPDGTDLDEITLQWTNLVSGVTFSLVVNNEPADYFNSIIPFDLLYTTYDGTGYNDYEITLTGENEFGCIDDSVYNVRVYQTPVIDFDIVSPNPACEGDYTFEFDVITYNVPPNTDLTWNWNDGTDTTLSSPNNIQHTFVNRASFFGSDNYMVSLTAESANGCTTTVTKSIELNPRVRAEFFADKNSGCSPLLVNFTSFSQGTGLTGNHIYQYKEATSAAWINVPSADISASGMTTISFPNTTAADLIYDVRHIAVSSVGGCSDTSAVAQITVFPEIAPPGIEGPDEVCAFAQSINFNIPATEVNATSNYLWSLPLGAFISSQNANGSEITVNFSSFSGNLEVSELNDQGCISDPNIKPITVLTGPTGVLSLNGTNVICPGESTSLRFDLSGPGSSDDFTVVYNNGTSNDTLRNIPDGYIHSVSPTASTNYFLLSVIDNDYPACTPSAISGSAFVSVNLQPSVTLTGDATICEDVSTNLFFNLTGVGPWDVEYTDGTNTFSFTTNSPVHLEAVTPSENTVYTPVSVLDNNTPRCSGPVNGSATITVNPKPTAEIFGDQDELCANAPTEIRLNLTGNPPWLVRYSDGTNTFTLNNISPTGTYDPSTDTYTHSFNVNPPSGTTSYTLIDVRDVNNCLGDIQGSAVLEANDLPTVDLNGNAAICLGSSTDLDLSFTGDGPFSISYLANSDTLTANNLSASSSLTVSPDVNTVYRIIELIDVRGCTGNILGSPVSVQVNSLPTAEISGADTICYGDETNLIFDLTGRGPWTVTYTDGVDQNTFTTSFNRHFEPIIPTATRTYSIISVTDSNTPVCTGTTTGNPQIFVYPQLEASFTFTPEQPSQPDDATITITNTTTNKNSWEYEWDFGDGTISNEVDPAPHTYEDFGDFVLKMTATNGLCTDTYQAVISIDAVSPIVDFRATPLEGCLPLVVEFENLSRFADPGTYQWEFGDNQRVRAVENPTHVYTSPGTYTVTLTADNITRNQQTETKEAYITVYETPQSSFTIPDEFRQVFTGEEVQFVNTSIGADEFVWKFGDGNQSFDENPVHVYGDSGVYDITLIAINSTTGCEDSFALDAQVKVILGGESKIANAFTPSRAGPGSASSNVQSNDIFLPQVEGVSEFNMLIYNRWGELLFESNDKTIGWDGYYKGQLMPQGVYVYRLELVYENGRRETKVGDITLIR